MLSFYSLLGLLLYQSWVKFKRGDLEWGGLGGEHLVFTTSLEIFLPKPQGVL